MIFEFLTLFGVLLVATALGLPIFLCLGASVGAYTLVFWPKVPLMVLAQGFSQGIDSYSLVAIPFFFLAGELMNVGGVNDRLMAFARACLGHLRGGLSHVNILASIVFAGITHSAVADTAAVGSMLIPAMKRQGYPGAYAAAVTAAAGVVGPMVPPSIPMVMFGMFSMTSVTKLFIAGIIPSVLMGLFLLVVSYLLSRRRGYPATRWVGWLELLRTTCAAAPALVLPLVLVGGIVFGIATATEIGALACAYAILVGLFYRQLSLAGLWHALTKAAIDSSRVLIILSMAGAFVWIIGNMGAAKHLVAAVTAFTREPTLVLLLISAFLVLASTVLESVILLILFVPMLIPTARELGIDMLHFGVVTILATLIGLVMPPIGILIYVGSAQAEEPVHHVVRELVPFILALCVLLLLLIVAPGLSTWLPRTLLG